MASQGHGGLIERTRGRSGPFDAQARAILDAATEVFLRDGYLGTNMDEIAALSEVSKQTVYKHFASKEALFVEIVSSMTTETGDLVHDRDPNSRRVATSPTYLLDYAYRQLIVVLTPRVMQLRRLVIGEVSRFPELAKVLYERGPMRAMARSRRCSSAWPIAGFWRSTILGRCLPFQLADHVGPLNRAMLLGDGAIPKPAELRRHAAEGVRVFLAAYARK